VSRPIANAHATHTQRISDFLNSAEIRDLRSAGSSSDHLQVSCQTGPQSKEAKNQHKSHLNRNRLTHVFKSVDGAATYNQFMSAMHLKIF